MQDNLDQRAAEAQPEFVAPQPTYTPHNDTSPQQTRHYKIIIILLAILAIVGVGFGIFGIIYANEKAQETPSLDSTSPDDDSTTSNITTEAEVRQFMNELKADLESSLRIAFDEDSSELPPIAKASGAKVYLPLTNYIALGYSYSNASENVKIKNAILAELKKRGFVEDQELATLSSDNMEYYLVNSDSRLVCDIADFVITCGSTDWGASREDISLANSLADAYYAKEKSYPLVIYRGATSSNIQDSSVTPYQTIFVILDNGIAATFYRISPTSEWQYFANVQNKLDCSAYNTEDLRRAFAGEPCRKGNTDSVVTP